MPRYIDFYDLEYEYDSDIYEEEAPVYPEPIDSVCYCCGKTYKENYDHHYGDGVCGYLCKDTIDDEIDKIKHEGQQYMSDVLARYILKYPDTSGRWYYNNCAHIFDRMSEAEKEYHRQDIATIENQAFAQWEEKESSPKKQKKY